MESTVYFYMSSSLIYTLKKVSNIASDEDIMENNYMFVMYGIIASLVTGSSHIFFSGANSKNNLRGYVFLKRWPFRSWDENFTKILKNHPYTPETFLIFTHKTPVVENHQTTGEMKELVWPRSTPTGITVYFYLSSSLIYILEIHRRKVQT